jgi:hypothetical protein
MNPLKYEEDAMKTKPARDRLNEKNGRGLLVNHLRTRYAFSFRLLTSEYRCDIMPATFSRLTRCPTIERIMG